MEAGARRHRESVRKLRAHVNCFVGTFGKLSGDDEEPKQNSRIGVGKKEIGGREQGHG